MNVVDVQRALNRHGFLDAREVDGIKGPKSVAALKAFQVAHGLPADGMLGPQTNPLLFGNKILVVPSAGAPIPKPDNRPTMGTQPHTQWPFEKDCMKFYGGVGLFQTKLQLPFEMKLAWDLRTKVRTISVHQKVAASANGVFQKVAGIYNERERADLGIDILSGTLNVRKKRGGTGYSMHAWGIAIDFDNQRNDLNWHKPKARLSHDDAIPFWEAWEAEGWLSLGRARDFDWMHVQAARL